MSLSWSFARTTPNEPSIKMTWEEGQQERPIIHTGQIPIFVIVNSSRLAIVAPSTIQEDNNPTSNRIEMNDPISIQDVDSITHMKVIGTKREAKATLAFSNYLLSIEYHWSR